MDEMKSALERAMERAEGLGKATGEELQKWKYVPEGEVLAGRCLKGECDLVVELSKYDDEARRHISKGVERVLIGNLNLPKNDEFRRKNKKVMEAIKVIKQNKVEVENIFTNIRRALDHYEKQGEQQRKQAYENLKRDFEAKLRQATQQQLGLTSPAEFDVERHPQFQEEWRMVQVRLESQYLTVLNEYKQQISNIS
ncbi:hypothetical protein ACFLVL_00975 [Chloroflexota bacterium]